jgi:VanZ family protein
VSKIEAVSAYEPFPERVPSVSKRRAQGVATPLRAMIRIATLCLLGYWLLLFTATHLPSKSMPSIGFSDKIQHALAFAGLAFLLAWAIPKRATWQSHLVLTLAIAVIYGGVDEITQKFIPGRHCDWWDFVADVIGACLGIAAYFAIRFALMQLSWGRAMILKLSR